MTGSQTKQAYAYCRAMARAHYENFPVASLALPRRLRKPVAAIYAFARTADDIADEGDDSPEDRLRALDDMEHALALLEAGGRPEGPVFVALGDAVRRHHLPVQPLRDLLEAFRTDVTKKRYADFGELMQYCRHSANPVGRLLLHLYGAAQPRNLAYSDGICSALQLTNFLQDLHQDYAEKKRIYIPMDDMERFHVEEAHFAQRRSDLAMRRLVSFEAQRAMRILHAGAPLGKALRGRLGLELRMIVLGGNRILQYLQSGRDDVFSRPRLTRADRLRMVWYALKEGW